VALGECTSAATSLFSSFLMKRWSWRIDITSTRKNSGSFSYIDFRSEVESRILTLWVIGTYFYTMFPAYPYLTLNGPKNSGKSTVLRLLQPLAFNMIITSDPTDPSIFRLIHQTNCTVGIDEAERYHNPKDPGMMQIKQLLNTGIRQGISAKRHINPSIRAHDLFGCPHH
jgi:hypothetical protein